MSGSGQPVGIGSTMEADLGSIGFVRCPPTEFESFGLRRIGRFSGPKGFVTMPESRLLARKCLTIEGLRRRKGLAR